MKPLCKCHGEPMEFTGGDHGGWRCVIKRRERQLRDWHEKRKHDSDYQHYRALNDRCRIRAR